MFLSKYGQTDNGILKLVFVGHACLYSNPYILTFTNSNSCDIRSAVTYSPIKLTNSDGSSIGLIGFVEHQVEDINLLNVSGEYLFNNNKYSLPIKFNEARQVMKMMSNCQKCLKLKKIKKKIISSTIIF